MQIIRAYKWIRHYKFCAIILPASQFPMTILMQLAVSVNGHIEDVVAFYGPGIVSIPHPPRIRLTDREIPGMSFFIDVGEVLTDRN